LAGLTAVLAGSGPREAGWSREPAVRVYADAGSTLDFTQQRSSLRYRVLGVWRPPVDPLV